MINLIKVTKYNTLYNKGDGKFLELPKDNKNKIFYLIDALLVFVFGFTQFMVIGILMFMFVMFYNEYLGFSIIVTALLGTPSLIITVLPIMLLIVKILDYLDELENYFQKIVLRSIMAVFGFGLFYGVFYLVLVVLV